MKTITFSSLKMKHLAYLFFIVTFSNVQCGIKVYLRIGDAPKSADLYENIETGEFIDAKSLPKGFGNRITKNKDVFRKIENESYEEKVYSTGNDLEPLYDTEVMQFTEYFKPVDMDEVEKSTIETQSGLIVYDNEKYASENDNLYEIGPDLIIKLEEDDLDEIFLNDEVELAELNIEQNTFFLGEKSLRKRKKLFEKLKGLNIKKINRISSKDKNNAIKRVNEKIKQIIDSPYSIKIVATMPKAPCALKLNEKFYVVVDYENKNQDNIQIFIRPVENSKGALSHPCKAFNQLVAGFPA